MTELEPFRPSGRQRRKEQQESEGLEILNAKIRGERNVDIARRMDLSVRGVQRRLDAFVTKHGPPAIETYREVQNQQLETLMRAGMARLEQGLIMNTLDHEAANLILRVMERQAKLLGLNAPERVDAQVTVQSEQERQLRELLDEAERREKMREHDLIEGEVVES